MTNLAQTLQTSRLAVTAECLPPRGADSSAVRKLAAAMPERLDAVVVADSPEEMRGSALACAAVLAGEKRQTILSITTRDRNRIALQSDILGAASLGIGGVLCLSGEHQTVGASPQAAGAYDIDPVQLIVGVRDMCEKAVDGDGRKVDSAPDLFLGAAAHPYLRPIELNLMSVKKKVAAGAKFLMTQAIFDLTGFTEWMDALRAAGIDKQVAIIASVLPLKDVEQARRMAAKHVYVIGTQVVERMAKASDAAREGIAIAAEMAKKLKGIEGVRGIHILSGGCESSVAAIIQEAALS